MSIYSRVASNACASQRSATIALRHSVAPWQRGLRTNARSYDPQNFRSSRRMPGLKSHNQQFFAGYSSSAPYGIYNYRQSNKFATWTLIGINVAVFGAWNYGRYTNDSRLLRTLSSNATISWMNIKLNRWWTLVTNAFSHQQGFHLLFNMFVLSTFSGILSRAPGFGAVQTISLYVGSAIASSLGFLYHRKPRGNGRQSGRIEQSDMYSALGASGSVMGFAAAAAMAFPKTSMIVFPLPIPMPLWFVAIGYVAIDLFFLDSGGFVAHAGHLGGFAYGALYYLAFLRRPGGVARMLGRR